MKKFLLLLIIPFLSFSQNGDTNGDGFVNLEDLFNVLENWLQNVNDNDPEAISNLDEMTSLVDSLITLNKNVNYGRGYDIIFPDGYNGYGFTFDLLEGDYVVPNDSIFYITNILGEGANGYYVNIDGITIAEGEMNLNSSYGLFLPIIINSQETISGNMQIHGMLFEKQDVTGITVDSGYTVEEGHKLFITNAWSEQYDSGVLEVGGVDILEGQSNYNNSASFTLPVLVNGGENISGNMNFNGYIVDEDYFSSVNNSNNNQSNYNNNSTNNKTLMYTIGGF